MGKTYTSVEVCAGAGGQAIGLEQAGFRHLACLEIDAQACATLKANRPSWNVIQGDLKKWMPPVELQRVDLLAGGVPCPPFSVAGKQQGKEDDRDLFPEMLRLAEEINPRVIMIENVRGLMSRRFDSYRSEILDSFIKLGYVSVGWNLLNASDFGVPQNRTRAILILMKPDISLYFNWPEPNGVAHSVGEILKEQMSERGWRGIDAWVKQADGVAPTLVGGSKKHGGADLGPSRARASWLELGVDGRSLAELPPEADFEGNPRLTVSMAATIQGFPREWVFEGKKTAAYRQVGNAFPPPVAKAIGEAIITALQTIDNNI